MLPRIDLAAIPSSSLSIVKSAAPVRRLLLAPSLALAPPPPGYEDCRCDSFPRLFRLRERFADERSVFGFLCVSPLIDLSANPSSSLMKSASKALAFSPSAFGFCLCFADEMPSDGPSSPSSSTFLALCWTKFSLSNPFFLMKSSRGFFSIFSRVRARELFSCFYFLKMFRGAVAYYLSATVLLDLTVMEEDLLTSCGYFYSSL